jgi:hypothetical protein
MPDNAVPRQDQSDVDVREAVGLGAAVAARDAGPIPDRKVATVLSVVTSTATDGVRTTTATIKPVKAGAGAGSPGGWLLVQAGEQVLAQAQVSGGSVTARWALPLDADQVVVSYTGDAVFAPSQRALTL